MRSFLHAAHSLSSESSAASPWQLALPRRSYRSFSSVTPSIAWSWSSSSTDFNKHSFTTGLRYSPFSVRTRTARTVSSPVVPDGITSVTLPMGHSPRGVSFSTRSTTSATRTFRRFLLHPFFLSVKAGTYSSSHRSQKDSANSCAARYLRRDKLPEYSITSGETWGCALNRKKWLGVIGLLSRGSKFRWVRGRAFNRASSSTNNVIKTSSDTVLERNTTRRAVLVDRTRRSHTLPKCGANGGGGNV